MDADFGDLVKNTTQAYEQAIEAAVSNFCEGFPSDDGERVVVEGFRQVLRLASAGHLMHLESDPAYPLLVKIQSLQRQMMLPAADAVYHYTRLHGDYSYRLHGPRGSAYLFQIAVYRGSSARYPEFEIHYDRDSFSEELFAVDEELDLVLSRSPHPQLGSRWIELPEGDCELYVRQYYYDWSNETPAQLMIERKELCYPPPVASVKLIKDDEELVNQWLQNQSALAKQYVNTFLQGDEQRIPAVSIPGAFEGTRYLNGHYRCGYDEAVILEVDVPNAPFWGFQLSNLAWEALDYYMRQTSINGHQAVVDKDGKFRAVIAHRDPGYVNWLDAGGRTVGLVSGRYFKAITSPEPTLTKVRFEDLSKYIPENTPSINPEQRALVLRERLVSAHKRFCSDQ